LESRAASMGWRLGPQRPLGLLLWLAVVGGLIP
jgi:hypothetical protein